MSQRNHPPHPSLQEARQPDSQMGSQQAQSTQPKATQPHIGIFGRRNTGKSSLLNYLLGYQLALVSEIAGTTTDSVEKSVEIPPLGPVVLVDTAGIDDVGELGALRVKNTMARLASVDLALLVTDGEWGKYEKQICTLFNERNIPFIVVWSKADLGEGDPKIKFKKDKLVNKEFTNKQEITSVAVSALKNQGLNNLILAIIAKLPEQALNPPPMLRDLVPAGAVCVFVAPIDQSAPKARLIAPQVQALRDCLDGHAISIIVQPEELEAALGALRNPPHLLVCDSQAVQQCVQMAPPGLPLTTYSILMARLKGDLAVLAAGAAAIHALKDGDMVCISEVCTHHAQPDDIGRVKIPQLLAKFTGKKLDIRFAAGKDYPEDIGQYKLIIHCGGCMINRSTMLARLAAAAQVGGAQAEGAPAEGAQVGAAFNGAQHFAPQGDTVISAEATSFGATSFGATSVGATSFGVTPTGVTPTGVTPTGAMSTGATSVDATSTGLTSVEAGSASFNSAPRDIAPRDIAPRDIAPAGPSDLVPSAIVSLQGVPITNYGVAISLMCGVLERSLQIFPQALNAYRQALAAAGNQS